MTRGIEDRSVAICEHIESFFKNHDVDVVCRRVGKGLSIFWADDESRIARLRPVPWNDNAFEIYSWSGEEWRRFYDFGDDMDLDTALDAILKDPRKCFLSRDSKSKRRSSRSLERDQGGSNVMTTVSEFAAGIFLIWLVPVALGSLIGGAFSGAWFAATVGAESGLLILIAIWFYFARYLSFKWLTRVATIRLIAISVGLTSLFALVGGTVTEWAGGGVLGRLAGSVVGVLCVFSLLLSGSSVAIVGLFAGMNLAVALCNTWGITSIYWIATLATVLSALTSRLLRDFREDNILPFLELVNAQRTFGQTGTKRRRRTSGNRRSRLWGSR
jgi:hypothetical protein